MNMEYAIGIDIGGSKIETDLVSKRGKILARSRVTTPKQSTHILDAIETSVKSVSRKKNIAGIGLGFPGYLDRDDKLRLVPNLPSLEGYELKKELNKRFSGKIVVENDANCFTLAETLFGAAKGAKNALGIIWGTGIGAGIIIDGKLYRGKDGAAGEFGHIRIGPKGKRTDIESFCGAPDLIRHYLLFGGKKNVDSKYIMAESDRIAKKVASQALTYLALGISGLVNMLNPEVIVIGGGISKSSHYHDLNRLVQSYVSPSLKDSCRIVKYKVGDDAGVIGAAALVWK